MSKNELTPNIKHKLSLKANTACLSNGKGEIRDGAIKAWCDTSTEAFWEVKFVRKGDIKITAKLANDKDCTGSQIEVEINGQKVSAITQYSGGWKNFAKFPMGAISIINPGLYRVSVRANRIKGQYVGDLSGINLMGPAVEDAEEDVVPCNADSVHLRYQDGGGCEVYYNQVRVTSSFPGTFFVVCGFNRGYFGMQENDFEGKKTVLFSIWDSGNMGQENDPDKIPKEKRSHCICCGDCVEVKRFGKEGTGCQGFYKYNWKKNETYHFLIKAFPSDDSKSMLYAGYFYINESSQWKHVATYGVKCKVERMTGLHCFVEDYCGCYGRHVREANFGPGWRRMPNGEWIELLSAQFTRTGKNTSVDAGIINGNFMYLRTGGKTTQSLPPNAMISTKPTGIVPGILKDVDQLLTTK